MTVVAGVRETLQDFLAPELREIKGRLEGIDAPITALEKTFEAKIDAMSAKMDAQHSVVMSQLTALLQLHSLDLRLARLESAQTPKQ